MSYTPTHLDMVDTEPPSALMKDRMTNSAEQQQAGGLMAEGSPLPVLEAFFSSGQGRNDILGDKGPNRTTRPIHHPNEDDDNDDDEKPKEDIDEEVAVVFNRGGDENDIEGEDKMVEIPWKYKIGAFSMIIFFSTGAVILQDVSTPLKSTFKKELGITNAQYGTITSATSLVNTILPIIGGIGMDRWGATYAAIISSLFVVVGAVVAASSANSNNYGVLVGGLIVMGFGSTVIQNVQSKLYVHWFRGSSLGLVIALNMAWQQRITSIIARASAVPLTKLHDWWGWSLWVPAFICIFDLALVLAYWWYERIIPKKYRPKRGTRGSKRIGTGWRSKLGLGPVEKLPRFFWILCGTQIFQNSVPQVYTSNLADIQTVTRGTSTLAAGYNTTLQAIVPVILTPLTGLFFDRVGWRMPFVSIAAALYIVVFVLIGLTQVAPLVPILISSFALAVSQIAFLASIPIFIANDELIGTAYGVWKSFINANDIVLEVAAGAIQDRAHVISKSYNNVIYLLIAFKCLQVLLGPLYDYLDGRWLGHALRLPEKRRLEIRNHAISVGYDGFDGWKVHKPTTTVVGGLLIGVIITAWVLYIVYSLGD
ncbi:hypothetical protein CI109_104933 [Kwoniella shandongensis]|uniref:Lysosomal dipeptide transporter MFSD1 n=1 Tax=Kwoniella shandongensis TaxID=1734106 RepID=A0A5M6BRI7_9TREE|nr:uncharacterized protein CI109_006276 [Kwoniella shandongensis]KAA5525377.1 hypothetical protein CI109_006276 [Kwoniella shandongensis]